MAKRLYQLSPKMIALLGSVVIIASVCGMAAIYYTDVYGVSSMLKAVKPNQHAVLLSKMEIGVSHIQEEIFKAALAAEMEPGSKAYIRARIEIVANSMASYQRSKARIPDSRSPGLAKNLDDLASSWIEYRHGVEEILDSSPQEREAKIRHSFLDAEGQASQAYQSMTQSLEDLIFWEDLRLQIGPVLPDERSNIELQLSLIPENLYKSLLYPDFRPEAEEEIRAALEAVDYSLTPYKKNSLFHVNSPRLSEELDRAWTEYQNAINEILALDPAEREQKIRHSLLDEDGRASQAYEALIDALTQVMHWKESMETFEKEVLGLVPSLGERQILGIAAGCIVLVIVLAGWWSLSVEATRRHPSPAPKEVP